MYNFFTLYECHTAVSCAVNAPVNFVWWAIVVGLMTSTAIGLCLLLWLACQMAKPRAQNLFRALLRRGLSKA
jgi:hypothetical protein